MNWTLMIRQSHRWLSIVFTLTVIANFAALFAGRTMVWLTYLPLLPLFLMLATGLYLFFLPYGQNRRPGRRVAG
tara:strand:- start:2034 stop:2255 length:222 start_codon:yes stop_codon:yes gene_type:complete